MSREAAFVCDREGRITWVDARAERLLGLRPGELLEARAVDGTAEKVRRLLARAATAPVADWELLLAYGREHATMLCSARPHGDGVLIVGSLVAQAYETLLAQMTEAMNELAALQRETERQQRELARLNAELRESSSGVQALHAELDERAQALRADAQARITMVAELSHELRTPINSILGFARLLEAGIAGPLSSKQEKHVGHIERAAVTLVQLVEELLDLSRIEAGRLTLHLSDVDVAGMFAALRGMFRPLVTNRDVSLIIEDEGEPPVLRSDEGKLQQILRNLITNALKFTERGEIRVRALQVGAERVAFVVSDTGIGIAPADQKRIFKPFEQVDSPLQRRVKGTGLGLTLSARLAEALGGSLAVESSPGSGSRFTLTVPVALPQATQTTPTQIRA